MSFNLALRVPWDLGDRHIPLQEVVAEIEWCFKHFPRDESHDALKLPELLETLRRMILEEKAHKDARPLDASTEAERIAELIYRLRDQNARIASNPMSRDDVLNDPRRDKAPASQLLALGTAAVPYLLPSVQDRRVTRTVGSDMRRPFPYVFTVGDAVQAIVYEITRRELTNAGVDEEVVSKLVCAFVTAARESDEHVRTRKLDEWWQQVKAYLPPGR